MKVSEGILALSLSRAAASLCQPVQLLCGTHQRCTLFKLGQLLQYCNLTLPSDVYYLHESHKTGVSEAEIRFDQGKLNRNIPHLFQVLDVPLYAVQQIRGHFVFEVAVGCSAAPTIIGLRPVVVEITILQCMLPASCRTDPWALSLAA